MITKPQTKTVKQSQEFKSYSFGIKKEGLSHIFNVLRNQLYSDKVLAVIREYSTNAVDAHTEVGKKNEPILVTLPNQMSPYFKVRDFGRGLTEKEIGQIYAMYGESTKRGTNEQIGQLGLGSKSAFAYGDNFVINSFVNGNKTTYNAFIDDTQIGQISKMTSEKSKEKDGIEIVIPAKEGDYTAFREKALNLFSHFTVRPKIKGADEATFYGVDEPALLSSDDWTIRRANGNYHHNGGGSYAVMGNIAYPLSTSALGIQYRTPEYSMIEDVSLTVYFNIGDLEISASREALQYTDASKAVILKKIKSIIKQIPIKISDNLKACKNLYEAKCIYGDLYSHGGLASSLQSVIGKSLTWNGKKVSDNHFSFNQKTLAEVRVFELPPQYSRKKRVTADESNAIICRNDSIIIIDDRPHADGIGLAGKMTPLVKDFDSRDKNEKLYKRAFLLSFKTPAAKADFFKTAGTKNFKKLADLRKYKLSEIYPIASGNGSSSGAKSSKHTTKEFFYDIEEASQGNNWDSLKSRHFKEDAIDVKSIKNGIYVSIDRFMVMKGHQEKNPVGYAKKVKSVLDVLGVKVPKVYAFKPKAVHKVQGKKNWVNLEDFVTKCIKAKCGDALYKKLAERNLVRSLSDGVSHSRRHDRYALARDVKQEVRKNGNRWYDFVRLWFKDDKFLPVHLNEASPIKELANWIIEKSHQKDAKKLDGLLDSCGDYLDSGVEKTKIDNNKSVFQEFNSIIKKLDNRYPLVRHFEEDNFQSWRRTNDDFCKEAINYINIIDATWKDSELSDTNSFQNIFLTDK